MKQKNSFNAVLEEEHRADRYGVKNTNGKKWTQTVIGESYFKTLFFRGVEVNYEISMWRAD